MSGGARFPLFVALRYLRSARQDAFTSFLSAVAAGGIALGVAALVLALAALEGMQRALRSEIVARTPALAVDLPLGVDSYAVEQAIGRDPAIVAIQRVVEGRGWVLAGGRAGAVRLLGYQGRPPLSLPGLQGDSAPGLYLPDRLATELGLAPGEIATLVSPRAGLSPLGPQPRLLSARVEGLYDQGRGDESPVAALPLERAEILFGKGRSGRLYITTRDLDSALELALRIAPQLPPGAKVATWRDLNRPLFFALVLERTGLFLGVSLVVVVAAMALFSDLQLVASSKRRELAVLAALGADESALRRTFVWLGLLLGGSGALLGGVVGGVASVLLDRWQLIQLPPGLLLFDALPFHLRWRDLVAVVGITLALTLGCAVLGATRAARQLPAEVLRG